MNANATVIAVNVDLEVTNNNVVVVEVEKKKKVNDKHYKFMTMGYWLLKTLNIPDSELVHAYESLKFFASNDEIVAFYDDFDQSLKERVNEFKAFQKSQKQTPKKQTKRNIMVHNNEQPDTELVITAPTGNVITEKKKRVKKVKEVKEVVSDYSHTIAGFSGVVSDTDTVATIVEAARAPVETKPKRKSVKKVTPAVVESVAVVENSVAVVENSVAVVENVNVVDKPAKKPRAKKQPVAVSVDVDNKPVISKKEKAVKAVNKLLQAVEPVPVVEPAPVVEPVPVVVPSVEPVVVASVESVPVVVPSVESMPAEEGEEEDDDDEEVITTEVVIDGVMYLKDYEGNLYDRESHEFLRNELE